MKILTPNNRICLTFVLLATFIVLLPNLDNGWVNWDDHKYVLENPLIRSLAVENIAAIFTQREFMGNYHPLTLLSLAVDFSLFGLDARGYHATNLLLHLANTALVFWLFTLLGLRSAAAALVALLFGVHPMHLESVAWISARKDVLYGLFFLSGLIAYLNFLLRAESRSKFYICLLYTSPSPRDPE